MCTFCHQVFAHTHLCLSLSPQKHGKRWKASCPLKTALSPWPAPPRPRARPRAPAPCAVAVLTHVSPLGAYDSLPSLLSWTQSTPFTPTTPMNPPAKAATNSWIVTLSPRLSITLFLKHLHIWLPEHTTNDFSLTSTDHISIPLLISLHFPKP